MSGILKKEQIYQETTEDFPDLPVDGLPPFSREDLFPTSRSVSPIEFDRLSTEVSYDEDEDLCVTEDDISIDLLNFALSKSVPNLIPSKHNLDTIYEGVSLATNSSSRDSVVNRNQLSSIEENNESGTSDKLPDVQTYDFPDCCVVEQVDSNVNATNSKSSCLIKQELGPEQGRFMEDQHSDSFKTTENSLLIKCKHLQLYY